MEGILSEQVPSSLFGFFPNSNKYSFLEKRNEVRSIFAKVLRHFGWDLVAHDWALELFEQFIFYLPQLDDAFAREGLGMMNSAVYVQHYDSQGKRITQPSTLLWGLWSDWSEKTVRTIVGTPPTFLQAYRMFEQVLAMYLIAETADPQFPTVAVSRSVSDEANAQDKWRTVAAPVAMLRGTKFFRENFHNCTWLLSEVIVRAKIYGRYDESDHCDRSFVKSYADALRLRADAFMGSTHTKYSVVAWPDSMMFMDYSNTPSLFDAVARIHARDSPLESERHCVSMKVLFEGFSDAALNFGRVVPRWLKITSDYWVSAASEHFRGGSCLTRPERIKKIIEVGPVRADSRIRTVKLSEVWSAELTELTELYLNTLGLFNDWSWMKFSQFGQRLARLYKIITQLRVTGRHEFLVSRDPRAAGVWSLVLTNAWEPFKLALTRLLSWWQRLSRGIMVLGSSMPDVMENLRMWLELVTSWRELGLDVITSVGDLYYDLTNLYGTDVTLSGLLGPLMTSKSNTVRDLVAAWSRRAGSSFWRWKDPKPADVESDRWAMMDLVDVDVYERYCCEPWGLLDRLMERRDGAFSTIIVTKDSGKTTSSGKKKYWTLARDAKTISLAGHAATAEIDMRWIERGTLAAVSFEGRVPLWTKLYDLGDAEYTSLEMVEGQFMPVCPANGVPWGPS